MTTTIIATWLLTYLIHSTIILVAVLVLSRLMGNRSLAVQEGVLRTALVGGILTATVQLGFGIAPMTGGLAFPTLTTPAPAATAGLPLTYGAAAVEPAPMGPFHSSGTTWSTALIALWLVTSITALLVVLRSFLDLRRLLQTRCIRPAGHMVEKLAAAMGLRRRVKVSTSRAIAVPFATGITQPEICCPERVNELAHEYQRGLFAHELAHLARHDPAWQLFYRLGEAVFSMQPLNRLVRRRLEEIAEHLADERAVAGTGDRLGLARCLVVVAHWKSAAPIGLPATTFAAGPRLDHRVRRLLSGTDDHHVNGAWVVAAAVALLIGSVSILPAIGATAAFAEVTSTPDDELTSRTLATEETKAGSKFSERKTWSIADERPTDAPAPTLPSSVPPAPDAPPVSEATPAAQAPPVPATAPVPRVAPASRAPAPPAPSSEPTTGSLAPPVRPATAAPPMPSAKPAPAVVPEQPAPAAAPQPPETERRSEEQEARERARRSAEQRVRVQEEQHSRAEAMVREQRVIAREQAESARRLAEEAARQSRVSEADLREIRIQVRERQAVAQREARELSTAERDRARALVEEARAAACDAIISDQRITDEQREDLRRRAVEIREQAELDSEEAARAATARARALADEARRLAEQAEAERLEREEEKKQR